MDSNQSLCSLVQCVCIVTWALFPDDKECDDNSAEFPLCARIENCFLCTAIISFALGPILSSKTQCRHDQQQKVRNKLHSPKCCRRRRKDANKARLHQNWRGWEAAHNALNFNFSIAHTFSIRLFALALSDPFFFFMSLVCAVLRGRFFRQFYSLIFVVVAPKCRQTLAASTCIFVSREKLLCKYIFCCFVVCLCWLSALLKHFKWIANGWAWSCLYEEDACMLCISLSYVTVSRLALLFFLRFFPGVISSMSAICLCCSRNKQLRRHADLNLLKVAFTQFGMYRGKNFSPNMMHTSQFPRILQNFLRISLGNAIDNFVFATLWTITFSLLLWAAPEHPHKCTSFVSCFAHKNVEITRLQWGIMHSVRFIFVLLRDIQSILWLCVFQNWLDAANRAVSCTASQHSEANAI